MFYDLVRTVESAPEQWKRIAAQMQGFPDKEVQATVGEILYKSAPGAAVGEYSGIMSTLMQSLKFCSDPALAACLGRPHFSLSALCDPALPCNVHVIVPAEFVSVWASFLRVNIGVAQLYKSRAPQAPRVLYQIDEAGQLGGSKFEALTRAYTYGRGAGNRVHGVFQNISQMGPAGAVQTFLGSSQVRQFYAVRDYDTAALISKMLGTATHIYEDHRQQAQHRHARQKALYSLLSGQGDMMQSAIDMQFHSRESVRPSEMPRPLMTPDEIMNMPEDRQILFISGVNCPPVYARRYPYYTRRVMAGAFLPNPCHPPYDHVVIGGKKRRVISERVPKALRHFPQYQQGYWSYVQGHKPRVPWLAARKGRKIEKQMRRIENQKNHIRRLTHDRL